MKRIYLFLKLILFTADYLHQAYVYKGNQHNRLTIELVINEIEVGCDTPVVPGAFLVAMWKLAGMV